MIFELTSTHKGNKGAVPLEESPEAAPRGDDDNDVDNDESSGLLKEDVTEDQDRDDLHLAGTGDHSSSKRIAMLLALALVLGGGLLLVRGGARDNRPARDSGREGQDVAAAAWLTPAKRVQIQNYINGTALLLSVHITHHAGTMVCHEMRQVGSAPDSACNGPGKSGIWPENVTTRTKSVPYDEIPIYVKTFRPFFHFMAWEYHTFANLHHTNWEYEDLVSMIVMKDPMERFLSGGRCGKAHGVLHAEPRPTPEDQELWWEYANDECSDNFALRVLAENKQCVDGARTSAACLEGAKSLLRRFTFVLDASCLGDSMAALGAALHLNITPQDLEGHLHHQHVGVRERLNNDTLYEYLRHRFRRDIELYEWSKERSIVRCPAGEGAHCSYATSRECNKFGCSWSGEDNQCRPRGARAHYNDNVSSRSPDPVKDGEGSFSDDDQTKEKRAEKGKKKQKSRGKGNKRRGKE